MTQVQGRKGGKESKPRQPVEARDSLISIARAKVIDIISEGDIYGLVTGDGQSIYLSETPAAGPQGSNYEGFTFEQRLGTQDQTYIKGFPSAENERDVGFELKQAQPWVTSINRLDLSAVRIRIEFPRMVTANDSGDRNGSSVVYRVFLSTDGGPMVEHPVPAAIGKNNGKYERSHRVDLPKATTGWTLRVVRETPDSTSDQVANSTIIRAYTEIIDAKFRYPNTALIGVQFDASTFDAVPTRGYHIKGRIIEVPSNYDPVSRTYAGVWNGTFKRAYTNNPAWIYRDILLHPRYGLGRRITAAQVDKWSLYRIAQYCDQMVPDGKGGVEPRFTCNVYLQKRQAAIKVLSDIASVFRGMTYWAQGQAMAVADMPADPVYTFSESNVIDGSFERVGSPLNTRYSVALVSWNDPKDFYRSKVEYVEDSTAIGLFGIQKVELTAFGCTSQGQAQRAGRWALVTNMTESATIRFKVGADGLLVLPGEVFKVADNSLAGRRFAGRIISSTTNSVTVDSVEVVKVGDTLTVITSDGRAVERLINSVDRNVLGFATEIEQKPVRGSQWVIEASDLRAELYTLASIGDNGDGTYTISGNKHVPGKYDNVESGTKIDLPPVTVIPPGIMPKPENVHISDDYMLDQTMAVSSMEVEWDKVQDAIKYEVQWRRNDGEWIRTQPTGGTSMRIQGIYAGLYVARVQAINAFGVGGPWGYSVLTELHGKTTPPPQVTFLRAIPITMGIGLAWGFPAGTEDTLRTEIEYGTTSDIEAMVKLGDYAYPINGTQMLGLKSGLRLWFRARLVDRTGNVGPWSPLATGLTESSPDVILDYLKDALTKEQFGQDILTELDKISGEGPGSVNERIGDLREDLEEQISQYTDALVWQPAPKQYLQGEIVREGQKLYRAKRDNVGKAPSSSPDDWQDIGTILDAANALITQVQENTQKITQQGTRIDAEAARITALTIRMTNAEGTLAANVTAIERIDGKVTDIDGKLSANITKTDSIYAELNPIMAGDTANNAGFEGAQAGVWNVWSAIAEVDFASSERIEVTRSEFGNSLAIVTRQVETVAEQGKATAESLTIIEAKVDQNQADVTEKITVIADEQSAQATRISTVSAKVDENQAAVNEKITTITNEQGAQAARINVVEAKAGDNSIAIEEQRSVTAKLDGSLQATYFNRLTVNSNGQRVWGGYGQGYENVGGVDIFSFIIATDKLLITTPGVNGALGQPLLAVTNGEMHVRSAFIQKLTVQELMVGATQQSLAVNEYGQPIMYANWTSGQMIIRSPAGNGYRRVENSNGTILVYDENNVLRVRLGIW